MAGQLGYRSKFFRGADQVAYARLITPADNTRAKVDSTHLESPDFVHENVAGFKDYGEFSAELIFVVGNAVQEALEASYLAGLSTPEEWSYQICHNDTGAVQYTYTFDGYIAKCGPSPISTEELLLMNVSIQLTSTIVKT